MWKNSIKLLVVISLVLVVVLACAPAEPAPEASKDKAIKVGMEMVLSGATAASFVNASHATHDYFKYINDMGGIEYHDPITGKTEHVMMDVMWEDNGHNVARALSIFKRVEAAGVVFMTVTGGSMADVLSPRCSISRIALAGTSITSAGITAMSTEPLYFTAFLPNNVEVYGLLTKWFKDGWTESRPPRVGLIVMDVSSQRVIDHPTAGIKTYAEKIGVEWLETEWVPATAFEYSVNLIRLQEANADLIITCVPTGQTAALYKDAQRLGITGKIPFALPGYDFHTDLFDLVPPETIEGVWLDSCISIPSEDYPGVKLSHEISRKYRGKDAVYLYCQGTLSGMVHTEGIKQALETVGYAGIDGTAISDALHNLTSFDTMGLGPVITIDPKMPVISREAKKVMVEGGQLKTVGDWTPYPKERKIYPERLW